MNTELTASAPVLVTRHPTAPSLWERVLRWSAAWRAAALARAEARALAELSDATLRDIGLAERAMPYRRQSTLDEMGRNW
jgi:uncharacterized protein YjiS (DUF1127 family)